MPFALGLANDGIKLPVTERISICYGFRAAVYGQSFWRPCGLYSLCLTLFSAGLFRKVFICNAGNIATVYVAVQSGGADCPLFVLLFHVHDGIDRDTLLDLLGDFLCICMVVAQFYFYSTPLDVAW